MFRQLRASVFSGFSGKYVASPLENVCITENLAFELLVVSFNCLFPPHVPLIVKVDICKQRAWGVQCDWARWCGSWVVLRLGSGAGSAVGDGRKQV